MREHATTRGLRSSSMRGGLTCDLYHALRLRSWEIEHWPHSGVKAARLGRTTGRLRIYHGEEQGP